MLQSALLLQHSDLVVCLVELVEPLDLPVLSPAVRVALDLGLHAHEERLLLVALGFDVAALTGSVLLVPACDAVLLERVVVLGLESQLAVCRQLEEVVDRPLESCRFEGLDFTRTLLSQGRGVGLQVLHWLRYDRDDVEVQSCSESLLSLASPVSSLAASEAEAQTLRHRVV